jgi:glutathione S-transferase
MKLYSHPLSGNVHKVRLLMSALGLPHETITVDLAAGAHQQQGELSLAGFPAARGWIDRIETLPFYVDMPGLTR